MFKRKLIGFSEREYDKAVAKYESYKMAYKDTQKSLESVLELDLKEVDLSKESAFKTICKMYAEASPEAKKLKISGFKLMEMREVNLNDFMSSLDNLRLKKQSKPNKEDYQTYTATPEQNERLEICLQFIDLMPKLGTKMTPHSPMASPIMRVNGYIKPNIHWIKSIR